MMRKFTLSACCRLFLCMSTYTQEYLVQVAAFDTKVPLYRPFNRRVELIIQRPNDKVAPKVEEIDVPADLKQS